MKKLSFYRSVFVLVCALIVGSLSSFGDTASENNIDDLVFEITEPSFPGGEKALHKAVDKRVVYPISAAEAGVDGTVELKVVILTDGTIGDVVVMKSRGYGLDEAAVEAVKSKGFPKFTPGRINGRAVNTWFTIPVPFKLQN